MKKLVLGLIIIMTFFINISRAYALSISIDDIKVLDKNNGISASNVTNNELTISPTITFNNVGDYVIYKVTFKGNDVSKYKINGVADNNQNNYITTTYKYKETLESPLYITMTYKNKSAKDTSLDDINLKITLVGEGEEVTIPVRNQNPEERQTASSNPQTGLLSHIIAPLVLIVVTILLLKHYTKTSEHTDLMILILCISLIPLTIYAEAKETLTISIDTGNIIIKSSSASTPAEVKPADENPTTPTVTKYYVYLYPNGGTGITEGQKFEYTDTTLFSSFPKVTKTNCTLDGWNVGSANGTPYYTDVRASDSGSKLYARWNCGEVSVGGKQGTYYAPIQNYSSYSFSGRSSTPGCGTSVYHDISIDEGIPIYAGASGTAQFYQTTGVINGQRVLTSYGNVINLTSSDGTLIIYAHLSKFANGINTPVQVTCPKRADGGAPCSATVYSSTKELVDTKTVQKGELIGYTGDTGNSTGPHLHIEIRKSGSCVCDPFGAFGMRSSQC